MVNFRKFYCQLCIAVIFGLSSCNLNSKEDSVKEPVQKVEVRAVFINCDLDETKSPDSDLVRFQRQELLKHNSLRDCNKKLALTVRVASEPVNAAEMDSTRSRSDDSSGDDYVPVDHVFEGSNKKRVRLLNPYILRLRRDIPIQAYKLKKLDIVSAFLADSNLVDNNAVIMQRERDMRESNDVGDSWSPELASDEVELTVDHDEADHSLSAQAESLNDLASEQQIEGSTTHPMLKDSDLFSESVIKTTSDVTANPLLPIIVDKKDEIQIGQQNLHLLDKREVCENISNQTWIRDKRHKQKYIPETYNVEYRHAQNIFNDHFHQGTESNSRMDHSSMEDDLDEDYQKPVGNRETDDFDEGEVESLEHSEPHHTDTQKWRKSRKSHTINNTDSAQESIPLKRHGGISLQDFALYEIGSPNLWYSVQVQLFEKMSTADGKTVWNDFTNGEQASVSSVKPEWTGRDMTARYRPAEWMARDDFALPAASLCLLEPILSDSYSFDDYRIPRNASNRVHEYIIVPREDVVLFDEKISEHKKRDYNVSEAPEADETLPAREPRPPRVEVRVSRALYGGKTERYAIAEMGTERFLTLPHRKPHRAQIDLEVRADDNQLVRVGSSGAIATVVADNTRRKRTVLTIQATNTGLASAKFRAVARDCGPELADLMAAKGNEGIETAPIVLPPQHTKTITLQLPIEIPSDAVHCSVALVNDEAESVAVRDVTIRKDDRCFCVWHCDCVCLGDDPKLLCREMSATQQLAAGLTLQDRPRLARSACYADCVYVNVCVCVIGVIVFLLALGLLKAVAGLVSSKVGTWGLSHLLRMPRKLDRYYECSLRGREVVYDCGGWPLHPDTMQRSVRLVSKPMEYVLNVIFFVALPCVLICEAISKICGFFRGYTQKMNFTSSLNKVQKCCSSQENQNMDVYPQLRRNRRGEIRRWMSPHAELLSGELWQKALTPVTVLQSQCSHGTRQMEAQAVLIENCREEQLSEIDSERDDTAYVLTQMQKSRESLAKSQKKENES